MGFSWDSVEENGNHYIIIGFRGLNNYHYVGLYRGLSWDSGKENGNYYMILG